MYIYTYIYDMCIYMCLYIYAHVVYVHIYVHTYICTCHICVCVRVYSHKILYVKYASLIVSGSREMFCFSMT